MAIRVPPTPAVLPGVAAVKVGVPVRAETLLAFAAGAAHLIGSKMRRATSLHVGFDLSAGPLVETTPKGAGGTWRLVWPKSPRASLVWFWFRYQADSEDAAHEITADLRRVDDGSLIDKGVIWTADQLIGDPTITEDGRAVWPLRVAHSGFRVDPAAGPLAQTAPRLLTLSGVDTGDLVELRLIGTDCRVTDVSAWEYQGTEIDQQE